MSETVTSVSFQDCLHELIEAGGAAAQQEYRSWRARPLNRPAYGKVIAFVESFTHRFLFEITEEMLEETKRRSVHALGQLKKEEAEDRRIEDFDTLCHPSSVSYVPRTGAAGSNMARLVELVDCGRRQTFLHSGGPTAIPLDHDQ